MGRVTLVRAPIALVAAALVLAGCVTDAGDNGSTPSSFAASAATVSRTPEPTARELPDDVPIEAGEYVYSAIPGLRISFDVAADDWLSWGPGVSKDGPSPPLLVGFGFAEVSGVYADPCRWQSGRIQNLGPSVEDLATALASLPGFEVVTPPTAVTAYGLSGTYLEMSVADDTVIDNCDAGEFNSYIWTDGWPRYHQGPGQIEQFWIFDVKGTRLVVNATHFPDSSATDLAELDAILESIKVVALE